MLNECSQEIGLGKKKKLEMKVIKRFTENPRRLVLLHG